MAASLEYVEFVCYRIKGAGDVRFKKMFGEYIMTNRFFWSVTTLYTLKN